MERLGRQIVYTLAFIEGEKIAKVIKENKTVYVSIGNYYINELGSKVQVFPDKNVFLRPTMARKIKGFTADEIFGEFMNKGDDLNDNT